LVVDKAPWCARFWTVPVDGSEHEQTLYMEDSAWPYEGMLDDYLEAAHSHYAPSLEHRTERSLIQLDAVFQAALGAPRRREVVLWQKVLWPERLPMLFTKDLPKEMSNLLEQLKFEQSDANRRITCQPRNGIEKRREVDDMRPATEDRDRSCGNQAGDFLGAPPDQRILRGQMRGIVYDQNDIALLIFEFCEARQDPPRTIFLIGRRSRPTM
jgi:hypothetical protein